MPINIALARLRETYARYTRYRSYPESTPDLTHSAPIDALRHKTGWFVLGVLPSEGETWMDGPAFEFVGDVKSTRTLPRPTDRITVKKDGPILILDYGARGEARRLRSPATRRPGHVSDFTGTRAEAGRVYSVADVQIQSFHEQRCVWSPRRR